MRTILWPETLATPLTFSYSGGSVSTIVGGRTDLAFAYNMDGTVDTITNNLGGLVRTFAYNPDGTVSSITVS